MIDELRKLKSKFLEDGVEIVGVFGSYARGDFDQFSDIDIAYRLKKDIFFKKFKDGFSQLIRLEDMKREIEKIVKKRVDFVQFDERFAKDMRYV